VNCEDYITSYLSAHADGELTPAEERAVVQHLGSGLDDGCARCRVRLIEERLLKALIRRQAATVKTPEEIQARINAALDQIDRGSAPRRIGAAVTRELRRPRTWAPLAAAAMLLVVVWAGGGLPGMHRETPASGVSAIPASEALDQAVYSYETFETAFRPTVPSASLADIAMAYGSAEMPDLMWNFELAGYGVVGGRIDQLPDGNPVTYTLYRGRNGDILCTRYKASDFAIPPGAAGEIHGHMLYEYKGYSLCVTVSEESHFICVLATSEPMDELRHDISLAHAFSVER
jgi:putative zinc finger protein